MIKGNKKDPLSFLDEMLGPLIQPPKPTRPAKKKPKAKGTKKNG